MIKFKIERTSKPSQLLSYGFVALILLTLALGVSSLMTGQAQAAQQAASEAKKLSDDEVKQGEQIEAGVKQATDVLNATLSAAVQGSFDATTALEVVGRIRVAYLSLENAKLAREVWASRLQAEKECNKCVIDLQAKMIKRPPKENAAKRE